MAKPGQTPPAPNFGNFQQQFQDWRAQHPFPGNGGDFPHPMPPVPAPAPAPAPAPQHGPGVPHVPPGNHYGWNHNWHNPEGEGWNHNPHMPNPHNPTQG